MLPEGSFPSVHCACLQSCNWGSVLRGQWGASPDMHMRSAICTERSEGALLEGSSRLPLSRQRLASVLAFLHMFPWPHTNTDSFILLFSVLWSPFYPTFPLFFFFSIFGRLSASPKVLQSGSFTFLIFPSCRSNISSCPSPPPLWCCPFPITMGGKHSSLVLSSIFYQTYKES